MMARLTLVVFCLLLLIQFAREQDNRVSKFFKLYEQAVADANIPDNETLGFDLLSLESEKCTSNLFKYLRGSNLLLHTRNNSVHQLSPSMVQVVAAIGDSITAGFGAKARFLVEMLTEYRGVSFSGGGDEGYVTLPNIIKKFNPAVKGFSVKTGKISKGNAHFNRAITGAVSAAVPNQVRDLIQQIKSDETINVEEDWKVVTLLIGGNDLCVVCEDQEGKSAANYVKSIKRGLDMLREELPKTFVNVVQVLDVTRLEELKKGRFCKLISLYACPCIAKKKHWNVTSQAYKDYNALLEEMVANTPEYHNSDDFTVVLQPFLKNSGVPNDTKANSYFGLDCFHFSVKGHSVAARSLWNNMFQPVGSKIDHIQWGSDPIYKYPTLTFPYFFTRKNSLLQSSFDGMTYHPNSVSKQSSNNPMKVLLKNWSDSCCPSFGKNESI